MGFADFRRKLALLLIFVFTFSLLPIGALAQEPLRIVTTIFPEYDFVRAIVGDRAEVKMLIKPGAESHSYEPTPLDIIAIQDCDIFVCVGGENDAWAQRILDASDRAPELQVVRLMEYVTPLAYPEAHEDHHDDHEGHEDHEAHEAHEDHDAHVHAHEYDEHIWTSPLQAIDLINALCVAISQADPSNAAFYQENAEAYAQQISSLDTQLRTIIDNAERKELVFGDRFPFLYFADTYGLSWVSAFPGCSTDAEASAATVIELIETVRSQSIPSVFYIELSTHRIADTICEATGAKAYLLHSCQNVTKDEFAAGETYLSLMQRNCQTLAEALN